MIIEIQRSPDTKKVDAILVQHQNLQKWPRFHKIVKPYDLDC